MALIAAVAAGGSCDAQRERLGSARLGLGDAGPACPSDAGTCVEVSPPESTSAACPGDRWLALLSLPDLPCPSVDGAVGGSWQGSKLFEEAGALLPSPAVLRRYCAYQWAPSAGALPDLQRLKNVLDAHGIEYARDCYAVGSSGGSVGVDVGWRTLLQDFHRQTGWLASLPAGATLPAPIRVAVVDTSPTNYFDGGTGPGRSGHGFAVGRIIREHSCPAGSGVCIGHVANHLAMPQLNLWERDFQRGGYFGSHGQVAKAIFNAVRAWREHNQSGADQPRLVVNLSLGWSGVFGGGEQSVDAMPLATQAVYGAITHAVCRGALVLAAAGNDPGGPGNVNGPTFPAGWEKRPAPTLSQCRALEGDGYSPGGTYPVFPESAGVYQPLVFAVSGVRADDSPLLNARPGAQARLAAPGAHALALALDGPTDVLTGTSASAAVTSAIAATVWGYRPTLTAPEIMGLVRGAGARLNRDADFCLGGSPCPRVVRANLCEAVRAACADGGARCPAQPPACDPRPAHQGTLPVLSAGEVAAIAADAGEPHDASDVVHPLPPLGACGFAVVYTDDPSAYPDDPCPSSQYFVSSGRPWGGPQPSSNPCPVCTIEQQSTGTWTLTLSIDSELPTPLQSPVLVVNQEQDGGYAYDLSSNVGMLRSGDEEVVSGLDLSAADPVKTARITFKVTTEQQESFSSGSELLVKPLEQP